MANYPTQLDEIDQWLVDNFGIMPGACSSTENLRYNTAKMVAEALLKRDQVEGPSRDQVDKLKKAADEYAKDETMAGLAERAFIAGANWQRKQDHDACQQCEKNYDTVFFKGEQHAIEMMKEDAIERTVKEDAGGYPYIDETELYDYDNDEPTAKKGDKVKVIILKDE